MNEDKLKQLLMEKVDNYIDDTIKLNDFMATNPELGMEEYKSSKAIVNLLRGNNIDVEYPFAGFKTAFKGSINPDKKNRVAILAEYDALSGVGHGCGHCASGSASTLAALVLNGVKDDLDFGVDIIGTPDEEITGGKCYMADKGIFDDYDFAVMVHLSNYSAVNSHFIALEGLDFKWHGQNAHAAAAPEKGRNALNAARLFLDATDMMRQHIIPEARIHGYIKQGGLAPNVVPDFAEIDYLVRAPKMEQLIYISDWVKDCAKAAALATKTTLEITPVGAPFYELYISDTQKQLMSDCFDELNINCPSHASTMVGSSDIGNVDYHCPAFHPMMGIDVDCELHTREFAEQMTMTSGHKAMLNSAKYMLILISKLYGNKDLLEKVKSEHKEYRGY